MKTKKVLFVVVIILFMFVAGEPSVFGPSQSIQQLPVDVARSPSLWLTIPKHIVEVGQAHGPLAALTWGPVKGTAAFTQSTLKKVWKTVKPDQPRSRRSMGQRPKGGAFRYEL